MSDTPTPTAPTRRSGSMLSRIDWELVVVHVIIVSVAAFMYVVASDLGRVPRRAPMWILGAMIVLVFIDFAITMFHAAKDRTYLDEHADQINEPALYQIAHIGGFVACGLLIYNLGYRLATPVFLTAFLLAMRVKLRVLIPYVTGISLFIYIVFSEILRVR